MSRALRRYLVSSVALLALAACGRGFVSFEERPAWRKQAEESCLKSGAVKVSGGAVAQMDPISGPGMCGAEFPLKVAALGASGGALGYGDGLRPPGSIPTSAQPRWPFAQPSSPPTPQATGEPMTITPGANGPSYGTVSAPTSRPYYAPASGPGSAPAQTYPQPSFMPPRGETISVDPEEDDIPDDAILPDKGPQTQRAYEPPRASQRVPQLPQMAPPKGLYTGASQPVAITPVATLACPIVSALDQWVASTVQPAAQRWFGQPVVEIKQISAYSCRGMNGNPGAHISEHAFGNALDISAFVLADGRRITIKAGWNASPEEQGFLHDVQGGACDTFTTVLAPGSNKYHYDHIHVDLMRRASRRLICQPRAIPGEVAAARAASRLAGRSDPTPTGSIGNAASNKKHAANFKPKYAIPGEDDIFDEDIDEMTSPAAQKRLEHKPGK